MTPHAYVQNCQFSDGTTIEFEPNDIVVFVGPNNSGKSQALKDIEQKFTSNDTDTNVVTNLICNASGADEAQFMKWLRDNSLHNQGPANNRQNESFQGYGFHVHMNQIRGQWGPNLSGGLKNLAAVFCKRLAAEERLRVVSPPSNINFLTQAPQHPIHHLQRDDGLEETASQYFKRAFGKDMIVHRNAGNNIPLYIGEKPVPPKGKDRVSIEYIRELEKLDCLENQGDGMKSFAGVILNVLLINHSVTLLDEPEAFLHPPQARLLGRMIADETPDEQQIFIATHSRDVLHGLMDAGTNRVKVIRINRDDNINHISQLQNEDIIELWNDPLLRYSNTLSGLFHEHVILCESDSDCRFYQAIADSLHSDQERQRQKDVLYVHCGGKQRMPQIISALSCLDIPLSIVCDFDILNNEKLLKSIVSGKGGEWANFQPDWNTVFKSIENARLELRSDDVKRGVSKVLGRVTEDRFPNDKAQEIRKILKRSSPWSQLKETGVSGLSAGDSTAAYNRLDQLLQAIGIFVVPVGELEMFDKSIGNHGPKWVNEVLEKDLLRNSDLDEARSFVIQIYETI